MLVERGNQIANFEKEQYFTTHLLVDSMGNTIDAVSEHFTDREEANRLAGSVTDTQRQFLPLNAGQKLCGRLSFMT